jgi:hypothetical protein
LEDIVELGDIGDAWPIRSRFLPPIWSHTEPLPEKAHENPRLPITETGQRFEAEKQLFPTLGRFPNIGWVSLIFINDYLTDVLSSFRHSRRISMDGGWTFEHLFESGQIGTGDPPCIQIFTESVFEKLRSEKGTLHRELLVEQHTDKKGEVIGGQETIGIV